MKVKKNIKLSVIVNAVEEAWSGWLQFYNVVTGEVEAVPDFDNPYSDPDPAEEKKLEELEQSEDHIQLPTKDDIHEYSIMEDFADKKGSKSLMAALRGKRPFRTFKDRAIELGQEQEYYEFRSAAFRKIARKWCRQNDVPFIDDLEKSVPGITLHVFFSGKGGAARRFVEEMESSGLADEVRAGDGNAQYDFFLDLKEPETVLLIESWRDQDTLDDHNESPLADKIAELRVKYSLDMRIERFGKPEDEDDIEWLRE